MDSTLPDTLLIWNHYKQALLIKNRYYRVHSVTTPGNFRIISINTQTHIEMKTNWTKPSITWLAGINNLRHALAAGYRAILIRAWNQDCEYPILFKKHDTDFRNFEASGGRATSRTAIKASTTLSDFEKNLSLNYVTLYGSQEAMDHYYATGELTPQNDLGMGRSHLVLALDFVKMLVASGKTERANMYKRQYLIEGYDDVVHMYNFYRYQHGSMNAPRVYTKKLWVVALLDDKDKMPKIPFMVHVLNTVLYPLKYIPKRSVLQMPEYRRVTYRVGSIIHGYSIEFCIPKKFAFNG